MTVGVGIIPRRIRKYVASSIPRKFGLRGGDQAESNPALLSRPFERNPNSRTLCPSRSAKLSCSGWR